MSCRLGVVLSFWFCLQFSAAHGQTDSVPSRPSIVWVNEPKSGQLPLPERTEHRTFHSDLVNQEIGYCIYLPPSYSGESGRRYPVIYNLHGNGGNEFTSLDSIQVLDEGIQAGRWPGMIMVFFNGGHSTFYKDSADGRFPIESILITEFIPHVDATYRTIADRSGRCIEGFSMGGRGAARLAVKHPDLFCSLFCQAGNVPRLVETFDQATPEVRQDLLLGPDRANWEKDDVYLVSEKNADRIRKSLRIQIACGTQDGGHLSTIRDFHQHLLKLDIDHTYIEIEGLGHKRSQMLALLKPIWFDYHVESIRRAQEEKPDE
ncbi:MAG: alpha/beta hydrolase-fold protein [Planctomycetaceae bacterium]